MLRSWLGAFAMTAILCAPAFAGSALREGLTIDDVDDAFEAAAEKAKADDFWIEERSCSSDLKAVCQYRLSGNLAVLASGSELGAAAEDLSLIFAKGSDPASFVIAVGLLATVAEPRLSKNERGRVMKALITGIGKGDAETTTENVSFKRIDMSAMGTMIVAQPR